MTLTITPDNASLPTRLTIVSDKRVHAAVAPIPAKTENFTITVDASGESKVYSGVREIAPAVPGKAAYNDPIKITDSRGTAWKITSDDGKTAVAVPA